MNKEQDPRPDPWLFCGPADALIEREPPQYIVSGLFVLPSLNIVYGAPGTLKSFLLADAFVSVAAGVPWLDREVIQGPTMFIDFDNGLRRTHERMGALLRSKNLADPASVPMRYISMPMPWLNMRKLTSAEILIKRIADQGAKFIVIDNLGLISGGADENSFEMIEVLGNLRWVTERTESVVAVVHHQRKINGVQGPAGEDLRGHSSIPAAIDLSLRVDREPYGSTITVSGGKTRDLLVQPFGAEFRWEKDAKGRLFSAEFVPYEIEDTTSDLAIERSIVETLTEKPLLNQKQLVEEVKKAMDAGYNRIRAMIHRMATAGRLVENAGPRGSALYTLA